VSPIPTSSSNVVLQNDVHRNKKDVLRHSCLASEPKLDGVVGHIQPPRQWCDTSKNGAGAS